MLKSVLTKNNLRSLYGGLIAALFTGAGVFLVGNLSGYEAKMLIENSLPTLTMLCNTVSLAAATILALLLTLLGVSSGSSDRLDRDHYMQVILVAKWTTVVFILAILSFQLFSIPITETDGISSNTYRWIYWSSLGLSSILSGAMVTIILLLYNSIKNLIEIIGFPTD